MIISPVIINGGGSVVEGTFNASGNNNHSAVCTNAIGKKNIAMYVYNIGNRVDGRAKVIFSLEGKVTVAGSTIANTSWTYDPDTGTIASEGSYLQGGDWRYYAW